VSRFALSRQGDLTLVDQTPTEGSPTDLDFSDDGKHLYVVNASSDSLSLYDVNHDGSLVPVGVLEGLPASALGVAAG
jgi:6-phosphogluconolactonase (cycloisomerase 2 family)